MSGNPNYIMPQGTENAGDGVSVYTMEETFEV